MRNKIYTYIYWRFTLVFVECETSKHCFVFFVFFSPRRCRFSNVLTSTSAVPRLHGFVWKRQCFMAIEGRSHVCISCCTNIVQCSAWNKAKGGGRQAVVSMNNWLQAAPPSASYRSVYPTNSGLCASESSKRKKEKKERKKKKKERREEMPPFCSRL